MPLHWTIRQYEPDYGIDLSIELFDECGTEAYETLGEHLLVQVKGTRVIKTRRVNVGRSYDVEKPSPPDAPAGTDNSNWLEVIPFRIDTSELLTIKRMGASLPVLLLLVDTTARRLFFLCLTDYIDKVILPDEPEYQERKTKTVDIPIGNEITDEVSSLSPILFYGKRPKLYAFFHEAACQRRELDFVEQEALHQLCLHRAAILLRHDVWSSAKQWHAMALARQHLQDLVTTGRPGNLMHIKDEYKELDWCKEHELYVLWDNLVTLGRIFEEYCREWFLPTWIHAYTLTLRGDA